MTGVEMFLFELERLFSGNDIWAFVIGFFIITYALLWFLIPVMIYTVQKHAAQIDKKINKIANINVRQLDDIINLLEKSNSYFEKPTSPSDETIKDNTKSR